MGGWGGVEGEPLPNTTLLLSSLLSFEPYKSINTGNLESADPVAQSAEQHRLNAYL